MSFHVKGGTVVAEVAIEKPSGQAGIGCFRLAIPLRWSMHYFQETASARILHIEGEAQLAFEGAPSQYLGLIRPSGANQILTTNPNPQMATRQSHHFVELDGVKIEAIERRRAGRDLVLTLDVRGIVECGGSFFDGHERCTWPIEQGSWIRILDGMEYRRTLLLEVPLPASPESKILATGGECLSRAQEALRRGHYEDVVAQCRKVIESIRESVGESGEKASKFTNLPADVKQASKVQREGYLRHALWVLTNPAVHVDSTTIAFVWTREDAIMVLTAVAAEYRRIVESTNPE